MNIVLTTIGYVDAGMVAGVVRRLRARSDAAVQVNAQIRIPEGAFDARRRQFSSVAFMLALSQAIPAAGDGDRILGLTECDLFIPMLTFVFGQAQLSGRAAMVSLARLRQEFYGIPADPDLLGLRLEKETGHELGHTFGLVHCPDTRCVMSLATSIQEVDRKTADYCAGCKTNPFLKGETHESEMANSGRR